VTGIGSVRLIGVDTPETVHPTKAVKAFGYESSAFLKQLVLDRSVRLKFDVQRRDRYGARAGLPLSGGWHVRECGDRAPGNGHAYTQFPFKFLEDFRQLEREAREHKRGLWRDPQ
jgi:micrococcal nuclease